MVMAAEIVTDPAAGYNLMNRLLRQGAGLDKMREIIAAQGGNAGIVDDVRLLPGACRQIAVKSGLGGCIQEIRADELGWAALLLGAGRLRKEDLVDPGAGIVLSKKLGDRVEPGETLAVLHVNRTEHLAEAEKRTGDAFVVGQAPPSLPPLIYEVIS